MPKMLVKRRNLGFLGFPYYEVDSDGIVWSCRTKGGGWKEWHPLTLWPTKKGYLTAQLCGQDDKTWLVHHLVLTAFVGPKPEGMQGRHLNDVKTDNSLYNLCWGTQEENMADLKRNGRFPSRKGERNAAAKLTEAQVAEIRSLYKPRSERKQTDRRTLKKHGNPEYKKYTMKKLAETYGVSLSCISFAIYGKHWGQP